MQLHFLTRRVLTTGLLASVLLVSSNCWALPSQLPDPDGAPASTNKPVKVFVLAGQSNMVGMGNVDADVPGSLKTVTQVDGLFPHLLDSVTNWTARSDVYFYEARVSAYPYRQGPLTVGMGAGEGEIGPELQFGHLMGHAFEEQVVLIKTANGNRSLAWDFRPPSSGRTDPASEWEGLEYRLMLEGVSNVVNNLDALLPGYAGQGYEIAGFVWFQGHKDGLDDAHTAAYETNLVNLITDVRIDFGVSDLPVAVATVGFGGWGLSGAHLSIHGAQMAVSGDQGNYPEYAGNVITVDIRDFWREVNESPRNEDYHYNRNAATYVWIGDALGRAMVSLVSETNLPPSPDPMAFFIMPGSASATSITMKASTAYDTTAVEYYFENTTNSHVRDWDTSRDWTDIGLIEGDVYGYRVKARDAFSAETGWSPVGTAVPEADPSTLIFSDSFEAPVVSGYVTKTLPATNWIGTLTTHGHGWDRRGLYNEGTGDFSTSYGAQAYRLHYGGAAITTTNDFGVLIADRVYTVSFNAASLKTGAGSLCRAKLIAFEPGADWGDDQSGTILGSVAGTAFTNDMTESFRFEFSAGLDHANLGQPMAIRLYGQTGEDTVYDNVQLRIYTPPDTMPPDPDPMTFDVLPFPRNATTIAMAATPAFDAHGSLPVTYYFENATNGNVRDWGPSSVWTNSGLTEGMTYGYRVRARDALSNETAWSSIAVAVAVSDITAPTPDPMTFSIGPLGVDGTGIMMRATSGTDTSMPVEYYFESTISGHYRDWSVDSEWMDTGLTEGETYGYRVRARDALLNVTAWSALSNAVPVSTAGTIFYESFEKPVVTGYANNTVPTTAWIGATEGFGANTRGLYNEGNKSVFSTPYGAQGYLLNYTNSGLTTEEGAIGTLLANVTYTVSFNAAVKAGTTGSYLLELVAFGPGDDNVARKECRAQRPGTVLAAASGPVTTNEMLTSATFAFMAEADNPSVGKDLGLRLIKSTGEVLYDNVRLKDNSKPFGAVFILR